MSHSRKKTIGAVLTYLCIGVYPVQAFDQQNPIAALPYLGPATQPVVHKKPLIALVYNSRSQRTQRNQQHTAGSVTGQAVALVGKTTEQWLSQWGHAEINLSNDGSASPLRRGQINALFPWRQNEWQLWFTQWGVSRTSNHTTLNLGIGQRWLHPSKGHWGYNLFYDHRIQGRHSRLGIGLEQYYKTYAIAINGYLPLSGWHISPQQDELIQAARGVDIRLKSYLPRYPQLSFSLVGERYFGANVSLMRQKKQQVHPTALTLGVEYTPIPLLSAGYGFKLGKAGQHDHQGQLTLSYRFGVPLAQQLDPSRVANERSLAVSRLALVQRNQHIVLQHKPNDVIQLQLAPEKISGLPGEHRTFTINITTPRPLEEWQRSWGGTVLAAGGEITANAAWTQATVTLPMTPGHYTLHLAARNARGVTALSNIMQITVLAPPPVGGGNIGGYPRYRRRGNPPGAGQQRLTAEQQLLERQYLDDARLAMEQQRLAHAHGAAAAGLEDNRPGVGQLIAINRMGRIVAGQIAGLGGKSIDLINARLNENRFFQDDEDLRNTLPSGIFTKLINKGIQFDYIP